LGFPQKRKIKITKLKTKAYQRNLLIGFSISTMKEQFWNERYAQEEFAYGENPNSFLIEQLTQFSPGKALMICEGEGRNAVFVAKNNWSVDAFDISEEGENKAILLASKHNVSLNYFIGDANKINFETNNYDLIVSIFAHFPKSERKSIHQKMIQWLKPGGLILLEAFNPKQITNQSGGPKDESMLYTIEMLQSDFQELNIVKLENAETDLDEGIYHKGKADVIRFLGFKNLM